MDSYFYYIYFLRTYISTQKAIQFSLSKITLAVPLSSIPIACAAPLLKSMALLPWNGPLSFITTTALLPVATQVTLTFVPNGNFLCAAVIAYWLKRSPLAVFLPWKPGPYQDASFIPSRLDDSDSFSAYKFVENNAVEKIIEIMACLIFIIDDSPICRSDNVCSLSSLSTCGTLNFYCQIVFDLVVGGGRIEMYSPISNVG